MFNVLPRRPVRPPHSEEVRRHASSDPAAGRQGRSHRQASRSLRSANQAADQLLRSRGLLRIVDADADVDTVFKSIAACRRRRQPRTRAAASPISVAAPARRAHATRAARLPIAGKRLEFRRAARESRRSRSSSAARASTIADARSRAFCSGVGRASCLTAVRRAQCDPFAGLHEASAACRFDGDPRCRSAARGHTGSPMRHQRSPHREVSRSAADRGRARVVRATPQWLWRGRASPASSCARPRSRSHACAGCGLVEPRILESRAILRTQARAEFAQPSAEQLGDVAEVASTSSAAYSSCSRVSGRSTSRCASGPLGHGRIQQRA